MMARMLCCLIVALVCCVISSACGGAASPTSTRPALSMAGALTAIRLAICPTLAIDYIVPVSSPMASTGVAFASTPDAANGNVRYEGTVIFTRTYVGVANRFGVFVFNSGTAAIPVQPAHFSLPSTDSIYPASAPPNEARSGSTWLYEFELLSQPAQVVWRINGTTQTVTVPFTEPAVTPTFSSRPISRPGC